MKHWTHAGKHLRNGLYYALMIFLSMLFLIPSINLLRDALFSRTGLTFNFLGSVFSELPFYTYLANSIIITVSTIFVGLILNSLLAYVLARKGWRWSTFILGFVIAMMIVPFESLAVPLLMLTNTLGWLDTLHVQIVPFIADPFSVFLFYQFFLQFPKEIEQAAMVDGLGHLGIYLRMVLPNSKPVIATAVILKFLFLWDSYLWPVMVTRGPEARPLTVGFRGVFGSQASAYVLLMTLPTLIMFIALQRWFVRSIKSAGTRG